MSSSDVFIEEINGLKTAWLSDGDKQWPILLFLHGFPDGPSIWDHQAAFFSNQFQVIRPYARGILPSVPSDDLARYGADGAVLDLLSILDKVDPSRKRAIHVVGHDLGAAVAWNLAPLLGNRLTSMAIINGLSITQMWRRFFNPFQQKKSWYIYFMQVPLIPELAFGMLSSRFREKAYDLGELPPELRPSPSEDGNPVRHSFNQYRAFLRELPKLQKRGELRLKSPLLVLWGSRDHFLLPPTVEELEPSAAHLTVRILEGNHWIFRTHTSQVNQILHDFFIHRGTPYES